MMDVHKKPIIISVSLLEAALLLKLRQHHDGEWRIVKVKNKPYRIVTVESSELLSEKEGLSLSLDTIKENV